MPTNVIKQDSFTAINVMGNIDSDFYDKLAKIAKSGQNVLVSFDGAMIDQSFQSVRIAEANIFCNLRGCELVVTLVPYNAISFIAPICESHNIKIFNSMRDAVSYFQAR